MLICVLIILFGEALTYCSLRSGDCEHCWHREKKTLRAAACGVAIVIIGCLLVCYQFWYWTE